MTALVHADPHLRRRALGVFLTLTLEGSVSLISFGKDIKAANLSVRSREGGLRHECLLSFSWPTQSGRGVRSSRVRRQDNYRHRWCSARLSAVSRSSSANSSLSPMVRVVYLLSRCIGGMSSTILTLSSPSSLLTW